MILGIGHTTDGFWASRLLAIAVAYLIGLIIGIYLLPPIYINQFYTAQLSGIVMIVISFFVIKLIEDRIYPKVQ